MGVINFVLLYEVNDEREIISKKEDTQEKNDGEDCFR